MTKIDIVVYTKPERLQKLQEEKGECHWKLRKLPIKMRTENAGRIYIAVRGFVVGSFKITAVSKYNNELTFNSSSWTPLLQPIKCTPFKTYRYRWW